MKRVEQYVIDEIRDGYLALKTPWVARIATLVICVVIVAANLLLERHYAEYRAVRIGLWSLLPLFLYGLFFNERLTIDKSGTNQIVLQKLGPLYSRKAFPAACLQSIVLSQVDISIGSRFYRGWSVWLKFDEPQLPIARLLQIRARTPEAEKEARTLAEQVAQTLKIKMEEEL